MIALDTNVLARFYVDDPSDPESRRQREIARQVIERGSPVYVPLSVVLELEWVMRGFYDASPADFCDVVDHLLGMSHVTVERWEAIKDAADLHRKGLDFADALHWRCSGSCESLLSFDKRFAKVAGRLGLTPAVTS